MDLSYRRLSFVAAGAVLAAAQFVVPALVSNEVHAETTRTIRIIVPFPAGGAADVLARILGDKVARDHDLTVVVENRPGAGAIIGTEAAARAAPDANTVLITASLFLVSPHLRKVNYDPLASFEPICQLTSTPTVILVDGASPYRKLEDLVDAARAKPGSLTLATVPASSSHVTFEVFKRAAGIDMTFVPYPGGPPAINALLGDHITAVLLPYTGLEEYLKAGKLRALASASRTRSALLPEVPTLAESGYGDVVDEFWNGLLAPAKTPANAVSQLARWFSAALQAPEVKAKLVAQGLEPVGACGSDFATLLRTQYDVFGRSIRGANMQIE
jgi:tripartite-type tricarboxylate transporter receptor subunit TctC